jgi:hypothetical protein
MIGGTTDFDVGPCGVLPNDTALMALLLEWNSGASYGDRLHNLEQGDGLNSPYKLDASTVHGEIVGGHWVRDRFFQRSTGMTWYFSHNQGGTKPYDKISRKLPAEKIYSLND